MGRPELNEVVNFVREFTGVRSHRHVSAETWFEADLGITGGDGDFLLQAAMQRFRVDLASSTHGIARTLNLGPNEYLFGPEGFDPIGDCVWTLIRWIRRSPKPVYRDVTVGELRDAIGRAPHLARSGVA